MQDGRLSLTLLLALSATFAPGRGSVVFDPGRDVLEPGSLRSLLSRHQTAVDDRAGGLRGDGRQLDLRVTQACSGGFWRRC